MLSGGKEIINTSVFEARDFHLSHNDNAFSIEFSTRELNNSERITYLYTINNTPWVKLPKGVNRVSFSDLPPGDYHFRIKAEDYLLESDTDEITIHIAPACRPWLRSTSSYARTKALTSGRGLRA